MKNEIKVDIYTDGACSGNPGAGGWGFVLIYNNVEREGSGAEKETTNNRMEITAVIEALSRLKVPCKVNLYSDSAYVINSFINGWINT
ncbi:MAG: RNase H family protein, partial [Clostridia bacterium]